MLVFPEVLDSQELQELNEMIQPIDKFFTEECKLLINNYSFNLLKTSNYCKSILYFEEILLFENWRFNHGLF